MSLLPYTLAGAGVDPGVGTADAAGSRSAADGAKTTPPVNEPVFERILVLAGIFPLFLLFALKIFPKIKQRSFGSPASLRTPEASPG